MSYNSSVPSHQEEDREEMSANVPTQYSSLYQGLPHCPQLMSLFLLALVREVVLEMKLLTLLTMG